MREFVFRGKPKNEAEYKMLRELCEDDCENGFVYGSLVVSHGKYYICVMAIHVRSGIDNYITTMIEVFPETVGEGTGLKDKNGKRIFEGDIVTYEDAMEDFIGYRGGVFLNCGEVGISARDGIDFTNRQTVDMSYLYESETMVDCEIIGNIHDNPELLEKNEQ